MKITHRIQVGLSFCLLAVMGFASCPTLAADAYTESPGAEGNGSFTVGPDYKLDPELTDLGTPKGKYFEFKMRLADSKMFPGTDKTLAPEKKQVRTERKIFVY